MIESGTTTSVAAATGEGVTHPAPADPPPVVDQAVSAPQVLGKPDYVYVYLRKTARGYKAEIPQAGVTVTAAKRDAALNAAVTLMNLKRLDRIIEWKPDTKPRADEVRRLRI